MADSRSNYSLTTFNSSGELVQIKHALAAVQAGATSLGIRAANGVVLATETVSYTHLTLPTKA